MHIARQAISGPIETTISGIDRQFDVLFPTSRPAARGGLLSTQSCSLSSSFNCVECVRGYEMPRDLSQLVSHFHKSL